MLSPIHEAMLIKLIPKGWRLLRSYEKVKEGDRRLSKITGGSVRCQASIGYPAGHNWIIRNTNQGTQE